MKFLDSFILLLISVQLIVQKNTTKLLIRSFKPDFSEQTEQIDLDKDYYLILIKN